MVTMPDAPPPRLIVCVECARRETLNRAPDVNADLLRREACVTCAFWLDKIDRRDDPDVVRVSSLSDPRDKRLIHYTAQPPDLTSPAHSLGHGGQWFRVEWADGRVLVTNDLWSQGAIPERFRERLPVNATVQATHQGDSSGT